MHPAAHQPSHQRIDGQLHRCTGDYALASWQNVLMVIWRDRTTTSAVLETRAWCDRQAASWEHGVFLITVIQEGAAPPEPTARRMLATFLKASGYIRGSAVTIEGKGFRSALVRGVVTSLTMLAKQPFPHEVCALPRSIDLFASIAEKRHMPFEVDEARRALPLLRAQIDRQSTAGAPDKLRGVSL